MVDRAGALRPHWTHVGQVLDGLGLDELRPAPGGGGPPPRRRRRHLQHLPRADPPHLAGGASTRSPSCSPATSGPASRAASSQRAELLNLVLADLYGPRDLLRRGLLPPEVVLGHAGSCGPATRSASPARSSSSPWPPTSARDRDGRSWVLGRPGPGPVRRRLRPPEPLGRRRGCSPACTATPRSTAWRRSSGRCGPGSQAVAPPDVRRPPHRRPHARARCSETAFEHALLASRLGLLAGRGVRPHRPGRAGLDAIPRSPGAGRRDPAAGRQRATATPSSCAPTRSSGCPAWSRPAAAAPCRWSTRWAARVLENPGLLPFLPALAQPLLGTDLRDAVGSHLVVRRRPPGSTTCWPISTSSCSSP